MTADAPVGAYLLEDPSRSLGWRDLRDLADDSGPLWVHMDRTDPESQRWVRGEAGLDPLVIAGLLDENTRPRIIRVGEGLLATIRGVNLNEGADPEDMISLRVWATRGRILTLRLAKLASVRSVMERVESGTGPRTTGGVFAALIAGLSERAEPVVLSIDEHLDDLEEQTIDPKRADPDRSELIDVRQRIITLHRYLAPQSEAIRGVGDIAPSWLEPAELSQIRESANRLTRLVEDLQAASTRAMVVQDEISNRLTERLSNRTYALTVIAAIVLPLTLLTGVFGMNVGGMPWLESPAGFWIVCGGMAICGGAGYWIAVTRRWL
ncbi:MAG: zinc transporter ZntB [Phycisphaerales bacterium]